MNFHTVMYTLILILSSVFLKKIIFNDPNPVQHINEFYVTEIKNFISTTNVNNVLFEVEPDAIHLIKINKDQFETKEFITKIDFPLIINQLEKFAIRNASLQIQLVRMQNGSQVSLSSLLVYDLIHKKSLNELKFKVIQSDESKSNNSHFYVLTENLKLHVPVSDLNFIAGTLAKKGVKLTESIEIHSSWKQPEKFHQSHRAVN